MDPMMGEMSDSSSNPDYIKDDHISRLPVELAIQIFSYLDADDLFIICKLSKTWRELANTDTLWKKICIRDELQDENFPYEYGVGTPSTSTWCRWAQVYLTAEKRRWKWNLDEHIDLTPCKTADCFGVHGTTLAVCNGEGGIDLHSNIGHEAVHVQRIEVKAKVQNIVVALNTIVLLVGDWATILRLVNGRFETEAVFHPETEHHHDFITDIESCDSDASYRTKTLLVTGDFVWFQTSCLKIYCRSSQSFISHKVTHITDVKHNQNWVAILRPGSIDIFRHNGVMEFSVQDESFYTGLVVSSCGAAFLESPDFDDPVAAYLDMSTRRKNVLKPQYPIKLKVYKLALFRDNVFCLNGRERFDLSCHTPDGAIKWIVPLPGSKYLRPGKDFFKIICSKFIFLSPAQTRLDVFDLYDLFTGNKYYTATIHTSSYNISHVSDAGLTILLNATKWRCLQGVFISWRSMA